MPGVRRNCLASCVLTHIRARIHGMSPYNVAQKTPQRPDAWLYPSRGLAAAEVAQDTHGGVVAGGADDRSGGVAAGRARIQPGDWRHIRQPVSEAEPVVDVMDVPARDPEMLLDLLRVQCERVYHQVTRARREAVA